VLALNRLTLLFSHWPQWVHLMHFHWPLCSCRLHCRYLSTPKASRFWCQGKTCQRSSPILPQHPAPRRGSNGHRTSPLLSPVPHQTLASAMVLLHAPFRALNLSESTVCSVDVSPIRSSSSESRSIPVKSRGSLFLLLSVYVQFLGLVLCKLCRCPLLSCGGRAGGWGSPELLIRLAVLVV
jgi:hypothetical protein